jgi:hypothetical protein
MPTNPFRLKALEVVKHGSCSPNEEAICSLLRKCHVGSVAETKERMRHR